MASSVYCCKFIPTWSSNDHVLIIDDLRSNALAGVGFVAPLVMVMTMVQLSTPPLFIGVASALTISARTLGGTVGYAIAEVIYTNLSNKKIPDSIGKQPGCVAFLPPF